MQAVNLHNKNEEFKATPEELKMIHDKMKDPEFMKLFAEYTASLADPKYREEEEAYLKQVEEEARSGGDHSFDFIFPKPAWVVELLQVDKKAKSKKVYINICTSEKVDVYEERTTNDRMGSNWHIPVSVSDARPEDYEGKLVDVFDAVFHPKTVAISDRSDRFMAFLVEIAVENINQGYKREFGFEFKRLSSSIASIGQPKNQTVKRKVGESAFPKDHSAPVSLGPVKVVPEGSVRKEDPKPSTSSAAGSSSSSKPTGKASAPPPAATAAPAPPTENLPKYTIAHRGEIDLSDAWNWKTSDRRIGIPKELVVKLEMVGVKSAADLDVDVQETYLAIAKSQLHPFFGMIVLPFTVSTTPVSAKFEKAKSLLTLVLTVIPPPAPPSSQPPPVAAASGEEAETEPSAPTLAPSAAPAEPEKPHTVSSSAASSSGAVEPAKDQSVLDVLKEMEDEGKAAKKVTPAQVAKSPEKVSSPPRAPAESPTQKAPVTRPPASPQKKEEKPSSEAVVTTAAPAPAQPALDHLEEDRAAQLREVLAKARREREEAEAKEEALTGRKVSRETTPQTSPSKQKQKAKEAEDQASGSTSAGPAPKVADSDIIDLTNRQNAWLEGVKKSQQEEEFRLMLEAQEAELKKEIERQEKEREAEREAKRIAKEQQKKLEAEKEAERLAAILQAKRRELPLNSHHIFAIN